MGTAWSTWALPGLRLLYKNERVGSRCVWYLLALPALTIRKIGTSEGCVQLVLLVRSPWGAGAFVWPPIRVWGQQLGRGTGIKEEGEGWVPIHSRPAFPADEQFGGKLWFSVASRRPSKHSESLRPLLLSDIVLFISNNGPSGRTCNVPWQMKKLRLQGAQGHKGAEPSRTHVSLTSWASAPPAPECQLHWWRMRSHFREPCRWRLPHMHLNGSVRLGYWGVFLPLGSCSHGISFSSWIFCSYCCLRASLPSRRPSQMKTLSRNLPS